MQARELQIDLTIDQALIDKTVSIVYRQFMLGFTVSLILIFTVAFVSIFFLYTLLFILELHPGASKLLAILVVIFNIYIYFRFWPDKPNKKHIARHFPFDTETLPLDHRVSWIFTKEGIAYIDYDASHEVDDASVDLDKVILEEQEKTHLHYHELEEETFSEDSEDLSVLEKFELDLNKRHPDVAVFVYSWSEIKSIMKNRKGILLLHDYKIFWFAKDKFKQPEDINQLKDYAKANKITVSRKLIRNMDYFEE